MSYYDPLYASKIAMPLAPVSISATTTTGIVDKKGGEQIDFEVSFGALSGTYSSTDKYTITLEVSDTTSDSDFAVVTDAADVGGTFATIASGIWLAITSNTIRDAVKSMVHRFSYRGNKRYARLVFTKAASGPNTLAAVNAHVVGLKSAGGGDIPDLSAGNTGVAAVAAV